MFFFLVIRSLAVCPAVLLDTHRRGNNFTSPLTVVYPACRPVLPEVRYTGQKSDRWVRTTGCIRCPVVFVFSSVNSDFCLKFGIWKITQKSVTKKLVLTCFGLGNGQKLSIFCLISGKDWFFVVLCCDSDLIIPYNGRVRAVKILRCENYRTIR